MGGNRRSRLEDHPLAFTGKVQKVHLHRRMRQPSCDVAYLNAKGLEVEFEIVFSPGPRRRRRRLDNQLRRKNPASVQSHYGEQLEARPYLGRLGRDVINFRAIAQ